MLARLVVERPIHMLLSVSTTVHNWQERSTLSARKHFRDLHVHVFMRVSLRYNPTWNESKFLLVNSLTDNLVLTVMDYNEFRKDTEIGASIFELAQLHDDATREDLSLPILKDGKQRGELRADVLYFPVLKPQVNESGVEELPESSEFCLHCLSSSHPQLRSQVWASCDSQFIRLETSDSLECVQLI